MGYNFYQSLHFVILIPFIVGLVRLNRIDRAYWPLMIFLGAGVLAEATAPILAQVIKNAIPAGNFYVLLAPPAILWTLWLWDDKKHRALYLGTGLVFLLLWFWENFIFGSFFKTSPYYRVTFCFICDLFCIYHVNLLLVSRQPMQKWRSKFWILIALILFFTIKVLVEIFYMYGLYSNRALAVNVYHIMAYVIAVVYLLFTLAFLWIPSTRKSMLP